VLSAFLYIKICKILFLCSTGKIIVMNDKLGECGKISWQSLRYYPCYWSENTEPKHLKVLSRQYITPGQCSTWEPLARGSVAKPLRLALNSCGNQYRIMLTVSGLAARILFLYFGRYQLHHQHDHSHFYFTYPFWFNVNYSFELFNAICCALRTGSLHKQ